MLTVYLSLTVTCLVLFAEASAEGKVVDRRRRCIHPPIALRSEDFVESSDSTDDGFKLNAEMALEVPKKRVARAALPEYPDYWSMSDRREGRTPSPRIRKCGISYVGRDASLVPQLHGRRKRNLFSYDYSDYGDNSNNSASNNPEQAGRIVGGVEAQPHEFPWQVSIRYMMGHICGGSLVANRFVLTAAHCFTKFKPIQPSAWKVLLGKHLTRFGERGEVIVGVSTIIIHPRYGKHPTAKHDADIAVIELARPVRFTEQVTPICIPGRAAIMFPGTECWVAGWGETYQNSGLTSVLRKALVPIIDTDMCRGFTAKLRAAVTDNMLCAGYAEGGVDSCQGDSGGPLMCEVNGRWVLSGIVSWGIGCAERNSPGIYTLTKKFVPWVMEQMKGRLRLLGWVPRTPRVPKNMFHRRGYKYKQFFSAKI